jgi:hypothetical protein
MQNLLPSSLFLGSHAKSSSLISLPRLACKLFLFDMSGLSLNFFSNATENLLFLFVVVLGEGTNNALPPSSE